MCLAWLLPEWYNSDICSQCYSETCTFPFAGSDHVRKNSLPGVLFLLYTGLIPVGDLQYLAKIISFPTFLAGFPISWWGYRVMLHATCTFPFNWLVLTFANGSHSLPSTPCLFSFYNLWHILYTHFLLHLTLLRVFLLSQLLDRFAVLQLASNPALLTAAFSDDIPCVVSISAQSLNSHIS